jgi:hypothetical protein
MTFRYEAFTADGKPRTGNVEANTPEDATSKIRHELGLFAMKVEEFTDGQAIRTVLNHEKAPVAGPAEPPAKPDIAFADVTERIGRFAAFGRAELQEMRSRALDVARVSHADPMWKLAYYEMALAADRLDAMIARTETK